MVPTEADIHSLNGVKPELDQIVIKALADGGQPFIVGQGLRSEADEEKAVAGGFSHTMNSKHLKQPDGWGWAVDLIPLVGGQVIWRLPQGAQWAPIYRVAAAMRAAAVSFGFSIRWGGVWDRELNFLGASADDLEAEVHDYAARMGGHPFLDGPHFEWVRKQ